MQIYGFNKTTLLDYPKHLAATIFIGGCNMRCPFCHNASLVTRLGSQAPIPIDEVLSFLEKRTEILEGICITGGEPTLYPQLFEFIKDIKNLGYKVKLDTNGTNPAMLKALYKETLIDYVALDIKNSKEKYGLSVGIVDYNLDNINESISYLLSSNFDYEFRTTIIREHHTDQDIDLIGRWIMGAKAYFLQSYKDSGDILSPDLNGHSKDTLLRYKDILSPYIEHVSLRGID